jgi:hypothetical protein
MSAVCNAPGQFQAAAPHAGYADWVFVLGEQERRHLQLLHYEFGSFPEQLAVYRHFPARNGAASAVQCLRTKNESWRRGTLRHSSFVLGCVAR